MGALARPFTRRKAVYMRPAFGFLKKFIAEYGIGKICFNTYNTLQHSTVVRKS